MNVLMVTFVVPHAHAVSGAALIMYEQIRALAGLHSLTMVTFAAAEREEVRAVSHLESLGVAVQQVGSKVPPSLIRWKRRVEHSLRRSSTGRAMISELPVDDRMQRCIHDLQASGRFDLLHVEGIGFRGYDFGDDLPSVLIEHEVVNDHRDDGLTGQAAMWRQFDRIQVFTPRDAAAIRELTPDMADRVRVNPFGVSLPVETDKGAEDSDLVLFVGGFRHRPNVEGARVLALEIMPRLRQLHPGAAAAIVGSHPPREVRELASAYVQVDANVPSVDPYINRATVVAAPLYSGGGMRVKILQAMAHGKAVVTTPLGAEGLPATSERPLIIVERPEDFAREIAALLSDVERRRRLGADARAFAEAHHSWNAYTSRLERMYEEAIDCRRA